MIKAKEQYEIFRKSLRRIEPFFEKQGYVFSKTEIDDSLESHQSCSCVYINEGKGLKIYISIVVGRREPGHTLLSVSMFGPNRECFSLDEYQESRKPEQIKTVFHDGDDLNLCIQQFFSDLQVAFETYLNDQITGKSFEDHNDRLMDSYYSYGPVYDMQKQVVNEAAAKREAETNTSLFGRLVKLFKG